jgi:hypothetical protein
MTLKWNLKKDVRVWVGLFELMMATSGSLCEHNNERSGSINCG